ncbi:MAG: PglZ domain-containing protein [Planctomycetes bacterium]|nr:PglZ domain-containing protein [Planctomycetota bacterium]
MGAVSESLKKLIADQIDKKCLVVWYDPEKHYTSFAPSLALAETHLACYHGSFYALRHEVSRLLEGTEPPRLLVYVPLERESAGNALVELEAAGVVLRPGEQPWERNTKLSILARRAAEPILGAAQARKLEKEVEEGKFILEELDEHLKSGAQAQGALELIFQTTSPENIALQFLTQREVDEKLLQKKATADLAKLLDEAFDGDFLAELTPESLRAHFQKHVIATDFATSLGGGLPKELKNLKAARDPGKKIACAALARTWRRRTDLQASYVEAANSLEREFRLDTHRLEFQVLKEAETFLEVERILQLQAAITILEKPEADLIDFIQRRQNSFWPLVRPDVSAVWAFEATAAQVVLEADRLLVYLRKEKPGAVEIFKAYTWGDRPLCLLDTYHRHMERLYSGLSEIEESREVLERLLFVARKRYLEAASELAERFQRGYQEARFELPGVLKQRDIFGMVPRPESPGEKTAYLWVDALRFEMARELFRMLEPDFQGSLVAAVAAAPTITEVGMAALLPGASRSFQVVPAGKGKLAAEVEGSILKDRSDRIEFLKKTSGFKVLDLNLEKLLPMPNKALREDIQKAELILITYQKIDSLGEDDDESLTRHFMEEAINNLRRALKALAGLKVGKIILTSDHGFLHVEEMESDLKLEPPGGETVLIHRRLWVGKGGRDDPNCLRARLPEFAGGELEYATPWTLACFKAKGGASYFHGGLSPQELFIPLLLLKPKAAAARAREKGDVHWALRPGQAKITTRFFSVQVLDETQPQMLAMPKKVRLEIRAKDEVISNPVSASYGFDEVAGTVEMRCREGEGPGLEPNTITLMINRETPAKHASIHLLDAESGVELCRLEKIEMSISL